MRLLIADIVRRNRWQALFLGALVAGTFTLSAGMGNAWALAFSMGMAFGIGPANTLRYVPLPIWYLPIAKRDVWRATWLVATVGATLLTTAMKLAADLVPQARDPFGLASIALSSVYDFAYTGVGCGLVILARRPQPTSGPARWVSGLLTTLAHFGLVFGLPLALYLAIAPGHLVPTHWTDLTPRSMAVLVAALCVAVATFFYSPVHPTPLNRIARGARAATGAPPFERGGLSGLPHLLVHEAVWTLRIGAVLVAGSELFVFVTARITQSSEGVVGLLRSTLLRLDEGGVKLEPGGDVDASILLLGFAVFATSFASRVPSMLRHLRVLPLGAARLNALLIAGPAAVWLTAWTALLALSYVILGQVVVFYRADALFGLIGVSAIVQAITLRLPRVLKPLAFSSLLVLVPVLLFLHAPPPAASVAMGLGGLAVAAVLNHRALARNSTYAPSGVAIGGVQMP